MSDRSFKSIVTRFLKEDNRLARYLALGKGPYFLAIQGVQGSGKTTLVSSTRSDYDQAKDLAETLRKPPWSLPTIVMSIDDFYLTHKDQLALAKAHPNNPLVQHRGQPSTHDLGLLRGTFEALKAEKPIAIPQYDKSRFHGAGDREDESSWPCVNESEIIKVVIFEGWSVGFRSLPADIVEQRWQDARRKAADGTSTGQLAHHKLEDLLFINDALKEEEKLYDYFQDLVHIDGAIPNVYEWRLEQEQALRASKGSGMTDEQVKKFIDGYYSSYELYNDDLRETKWRRPQADWKQRHVRIMIDKDRNVVDCLFFHDFEARE